MKIFNEVKLFFGIKKYFLECYVRGYYCDMEYYIEIVEFYIILFVNN